MLTLKIELNTIKNLKKDKTGKISIFRNCLLSGGGKTGFLRRLGWNRPSPTLVTDPTMPATDLITLS